MPKNGAVTFRDIVRVSVLRLACQHCARHGAYRLDKLIDQYGLDGTLIQWEDELTRTCPRRAAQEWGKNCYGNVPVVNMADLLKRRD